MTTESQGARSSRVYSALHTAITTEFLEVHLDGRTFSLTPDELHEMQTHLTKSDAKALLEHWKSALKSIKQFIILRNCCAFGLVLGAFLVGCSMSNAGLFAIGLSAVTIFAVYKLMEDFGPRVRRIEKLIKKLQALVSLRA